MKRALTILLLIALTLGLCPGTLAAEETAVAKMTPLGNRITAYTNFLQELVAEDTRIAFVGLADVNRDTYPELFYVVKEDGEHYARFAYYDSGDVYDYDVDFDSLGTSPKSLSLVRRNKKGTSEHCWVLKLQTKDTDKWNQFLFYTFQRSGDSLVSELKFQRRWKSRKQFFVNGMQTIKVLYESELDSYNAKWPVATSTSIKNQGVITKVSNVKKWTSVRKALATSLTKWEKL